MTRAYLMACVMGIGTLLDAAEGEAVDVDCSKLSEDDRMLSQQLCIDGRLLPPGTSILQSTESLTTGYVWVQLPAAEPHFSL